MRLFCVLLLVVSGRLTVDAFNGGADRVSTLHGNNEPSGGRVYNFFQDDGPEPLVEGASRTRRAAPGNGTLFDRGSFNPTVNRLNDTHKQLMVHWVGENSKVVICLARDPTFGAYDLQPTTPSAVYISYDDGETYQNQTEQFKLPDGNYSVLEKFYNHPKYSTHFIFTDVKHNMLYVTTNYGKNFERIELKFTPNELSFHELYSSVFVVLDRNDTKSQLWITEDFGQTFRLAHEMVKAFHWSKIGDDHQLLVHRYEPNRLGTVIYSNNLFRSRLSQVYATNVLDFFLKNDYFFTTKNNSMNQLELFVSYKFGKQMRCVFDTTEKITGYFIADVTNNRAFVAASHSQTSATLYVSDNLGGINGKVFFTPSVVDVFAYMPNATWQGALIDHLFDEAFVDLYKVEGLSGIYIASKVISKPTANNNLGPQHLGSIITFDHGASWRPIEAPAVDVEGQESGCSFAKDGCSLHLSQRFSQLYPETRSVPILSSKSAPGTIIATGVLGTTLKGHYGVYVSVDAGLTWRQTLRDLHFFNMGDHGGILSAVKYYKSRGETRHILYSVDEGVTWNQTQFHEDEIKLYGLMTEPGENTTVFTMFGSLPQEHRWIIVKVDFAKAFPRQCASDDYKMWSPGQGGENRSYIPCVMGEHTTYQRRLRYANCLYGPDYVPLQSRQPCACDVIDFECDFGFKKVATHRFPRCIYDKTQTLGYDPYAPPDHCPKGQFYERTRGYRKIVGDKCVDGFADHYLPQTVPCPFAEIDDFLLFAQRENVSRYNLRTEKLETLPIYDLKNVIAIDFDLENNCVYWADINLDTINRQCFNEGSQLETLVSQDLASIEGMALDWISKTLYFVDGIRAKIELIRIDVSHSGRMRRTILDGKVLKKPRGIAVHPQAGYMFWTDWSAENPSVNRASLDGSNVKMLFGREKVEWPNGITVDYFANRIYWVDARKDYIGSSDLHGDSFVNLVHNNDLVSHPFAVAVFKNNMYWDDWKKSAIYSSDKDVYKGVRVIIKDFPGLMDLKVYAHGIQIGKNACANASCAYICTGLPQNQYRCLCPDGMTEGKNGTCLCPGDTPALSNGTCPSVNQSCGPDHFACGNGLCVPKGWRCDGEDDCGDESDEDQCHPLTCPPTFHLCGDGKCLPSYWRCDYDSDCADGSDERNCPKPNCTDTQFECDNGRCISKNWRCDGENDCRDNSDERNCDPVKPTHCKSEDEFQCKSGAVTCVPTTWKCDDEPDCRDGSDELNCSNNTCSESQFSCGPPNNRCIFASWVCDGDRDCSDGRDEQNCTTPRPDLISPIPPFYTRQNNTCQDWMFKCKNDRCVPYWWRCDGVDDCGDISDEADCLSVTTTTAAPLPTRFPISPTNTRCPDDQFRCSNGKCIFSSWVCDAYLDCPGGEDEEHCVELNVHDCPPDRFKCYKDGSCIPKTMVCDNIADCPDQTDELYCKTEYKPEKPSTPSCMIGYFPCDGKSCYLKSQICDDIPDCIDGTDEQNCSNSTKIYQALIAGKTPTFLEDTALDVYWTVAPRNGNDSLEFLPSISKAGEDAWRNMTWTERTRFQFTGLLPFTTYNMTVYVRKKGSTEVFPPGKYYVARTLESIPSEPLNLVVRQQNGSHIVLTWDAPLRPNGVIKYYKISSVPSKIYAVTPSNATNFTLYNDVRRNETYSLTVTAFNGQWMGRPSEKVRLNFNSDLLLTEVNRLTAKVTSNDSLEVSWQHRGEVDEFVVRPVAHALVGSDLGYPSLPTVRTKSTMVALYVAPGARYTISVVPRRDGRDGPLSTVQLTMPGAPLPLVELTDVRVLKEVGNSAKFSWQRPEKNSKVAWEYGVYYGASYEALTSAVAAVKTKNLTVTLTNLTTCKLYLAAVGIVGPHGVGPINYKKEMYFATSYDLRAPPKSVKVLQSPNNPYKMTIKWEPTCPDALGKSAYILYIDEVSSTNQWRISVGKKLSHTMSGIEPGARYSVSVATNETNAIKSKPIVFAAKPIEPPPDVRVIPETNGSFIVYWSEHDLKSNGSTYEVLVSPGTKLDERTAQTFVVDRPPFEYYNESVPTYTFAVRSRSKKGYKSMLSQSQSKVSERLVSDSTVNLPAIIVPVLLVLVALGGAIVFLVIRNRRLHNSFVRFANSHYNSRSGAATFDDNGLEEEESPRIVGFSDDEPLVVP